MPIAVAFSLSALASAIFASWTSLSVPSVAIPTLVTGGLWAMLLRARRVVGRGRVRWGWLASIPLAMLNAGLVSASSIDMGKGVASYEAGRATHPVVAPERTAVR